MEIKKPIRFTLILTAILVVFLVGLHLFAYQKKAEEVVVPEAVNYFMVVVTGTEEVDPLGVWGASELKQLFGVKEEGGLILHLPFTGDFLNGAEDFQSFLLEAVKDPQAKVLILSRGVPGITNILARLREDRPDIFILVGDTWEDPGPLARVADLAVASDFVSLGYLLPVEGHNLGITTILYITLENSEPPYNILTRKAIYETTAKNFDMEFVEVVVPASFEESPETIQKYFQENFPQWLEFYGQKTLFLTENDQIARVALEFSIHQGGYFFTTNETTPFLFYPELLNLKVPESHNFAEFQKNLDDALVNIKASQRIALPIRSLVFETLLTLGKVGQSILKRGVGQDLDYDNRDRLAIVSDFKEFVLKTYGNLAYRMHPYEDPVTYRKINNFLLLLGDYYLSGIGHLKINTAMVPPKIQRITQKYDESEVRKGFQIAVVTGTALSGSDDYLGVPVLQNLYGNSQQGGIIQHIIYPDEFVDEGFLMAELIEELANIPQIKAIIVNQAIPGTALGFSRVLKKRPDILLIAGEAHEDPEVISPVADLVIMTDFINRGYLLIYTTQKLGLDNFVHISFARHMESSTILRRRDIMRAVALDLGVNFYEEEAPDPLSLDDWAEELPALLTDQFTTFEKKYGPKTAYFSTNDAHAETLIRLISERGGYYAEGDLPSTLLGFPEVLGVDTSLYPGDWQGLISALEKSVKDKKITGRLGTWTYPVGMCQTAGSAEFALRRIRGEAGAGDTQEIIDSFELFTPGAAWSGNYFFDELTGKPIPNYFLIYQDSYVLGLGYQNLSKLFVPLKYLVLGTNLENEPVAIVPETLNTQRGGTPTALGLGSEE
ncbi:MAG: DUF3798 domain-containing protein [Deltaproteobacteria bacterium]|jgi:hypothetical protein|nr:DUF3798 domain-containing protein [Deltaproteobacteria bacterium]